MSSITILLLLVTVSTTNILAERNKNREEPPPQGGKSIFFLGGLFRKFRTRWQNPPPSPYGSAPLFPGYYGCAFYNCQQPQQYQVLQPLPAPQPIQTVVQTPIVVQQSQVYQPNAYAQAIAQSQPSQPPPQPQLPMPPPPPPPPPLPPQQYPPQSYPPQSYPQAYPAYPAYTAAYAASVPPAPIYQNPGCTYPAFLCGRRG